MVKTDISDTAGQGFRYISAEVSVHFRRGFGGFRARWDSAFRSMKTGMYEMDRGGQEASCCDVQG